MLLLRQLIVGFLLFKKNVWDIKMEMEMKREEMRQITSLTRQCKVIKAILLADGGESFTNKTLKSKSQTPLAMDLCRLEPAG